MQVRVVTLRYSEGMQGFPEEALRKATFGREVLGVEEHFFTYGNVPHLALVLTTGSISNTCSRGFGIRVSSHSSPNTRKHRLVPSRARAQS